MTVADLSTPSVSYDNSYWFIHNFVEFGWWLLVQNLHYRRVFMTTSGPSMYFSSSLHDHLLGQNVHHRRILMTSTRSYILLFHVQYGGFHVLPMLAEFSGVVLSCFVISRYTIFTKVSRIQPADGRLQVQNWWRPLVHLHHRWVLNWR